MFRDYDIKRILISFNNGSYSVFADTSYLGQITENDFFELSLEKGKTRVKKGTQDFGIFSKVIFLQDSIGTSLTYTPKSPTVKIRKYSDDLEVSANSKELNLVNLVDASNYLKGVVESEGGSGKPLAYYQVQALMSRTYALKHIGRHKKEGFDLCDRVHCQAYHNMLRFNPIIDSAVRQTADEVLEDAYGEMISTYFHANCGGQTCEPEHVWNEDLHYLTTFVDTFCIYTKQATWEKRIPQTEWRDFLVRKYGFPIADTNYAKIIYTFEQPQRMAFYISPVFGIPLRDIREKFDLKSTYFSCFPDGNDVVIRGRGYGHGVGLCQEGAMKMAKYGYNYVQIARYYFPGAKIVNYREQLFYKQRNSNL